MIIYTPNIINYTQLNKKINKKQSNKKKLTCIVSFKPRTLSLIAITVWVPFIFMKWLISLFIDVFWMFFFLHFEHLSILYHWYNTQDTTHK